jgi:hypothetical protein
MDLWQWLKFAIGVILVVFVGGLAFLILWKIYKDKIDLSQLISEPVSGEASLSRFQFLVFTFVIAMSLSYLTATGPTFPKVPVEILGLLGISGGSYVISKGIQTSRDTSVAKIEHERKDSTRTDTTRPDGARTAGPTRMDPGL